MWTIRGSSHKAVDGGSGVADHDEVARTVAPHLVRDAHAVDRGGESRFGNLGHRRTVCRKTGPNPPHLEGQEGSGRS
jgi:hypothetical protein